MRCHERLALATALVGIGCRGFGGVEVVELATVAGKPSNVASLVTVEQQGQPVANLQSSAFHVSEEGQQLDGASVDLALIDTARVIDFHTILLLDLGHGSTEESQRALRHAVVDFVRNLRARQSVTLLGFDGLSKVRILKEYPVDGTASMPAVPEAREFSASDQSRNLRGAVVQALDMLDTRLGRSPKPWRVGSLVLFTRGPDVAGRVSQDEFERRLSRNRHRLIAVSLNGDSTSSDLARLARNGRIEALSAEPLSSAFGKAASRVAELSGNHYLISYCSPARDGKRHLTVEVQVVQDDLETKRGTFETTFDAAGFTAHCDSSQLPQFPKTIAVRTE